MVVEWLIREETALDVPLQKEVLAYSCSARPIRLRSPATTDAASS